MTGQDQSPTAQLSEALSTAAAAVKETMVELLTPPNPAATRLWQAMRYAALSGGKRLRPFFVLQSAQLCGVSGEPALRTAAAVEMVHAYSLAHDDLPAMDDDSMRRGQPTVHRQFDEATAILAGDALQTLAFEVLSGPETHPSAEVRSELVAALAQASGAAGMAGGQMLDLGAADTDWDETSIQQLQSMKTAALFACACELGAILGEAPPDQRIALRTFGLNFGLAFQITDDLMDVTGDASEAGKAVGKDAAQGKATLVELEGLENARAIAARFCHNAMESLDLYGDRADLLREIAGSVTSRRS
ncbi:MAG: polyprenyl synthetase family protein [Alphaproteobacteria bacterium]|nr:polyprenyl synthetase family protein [Alphaproteobacteria bacterium]